MSQKYSVVDVDVLKDRESSKMASSKRTTRDEDEMIQFTNQMATMIGRLGTLERAYAEQSEKMDMILKLLEERKSSKPAKAGRISFSTTPISPEELVSGRTFFVVVSTTGSKNTVAPVVKGDAVLTPGKGRPVEYQVVRTDKEGRSQPRPIFRPLADIYRTEAEAENASTYQRLPSSTRTPATSGN